MNLRTLILILLAWMTGAGSSRAQRPSPTPRLPGAPKPEASRPRPRSRPAPTPVPTPAPTADDPLPLPFGIAWGDSPETVLSILPRVNAAVKKKVPLDKTGEIWSVGGVKITGLRDSRIVFQEKHVVGIDLEYGDNAWPSEKYNAGMGNLRKRLETMFAAPGVLVTRGPVKDDSAPGIAQMLTGYEWKRFDTLVLLIYYSAEEKEGDVVKSAFRSLLIRYRFRDPTQIVAEPQPSPSPAAAGADPDATPTPTPEPTPEAKGQELPKPRIRSDGTDPLPEQ